jgi:hypothetical protein
MLICGLASAQQGSISGKLTDSTKKPLAYATVTVYKAIDTSIITYRLSNPDGDFKVPNLPLNVQLRVLITYTGFEGFRKEFLLSADHPNLYIDTITMTSTQKQLDDIVVLSERPPVIVKKDTIEFNASAFKTLPNALVEDLLKKLPGVQVDKDGNIVVGGKAVNRITVDGKSFFGDDPKMATRNLPANVIDKVQVTDDKEEMMRRGDDNANNVGKVINITLKKGVKKGWFGKVYAGGGTDRRYEAGGIANIYRDTFQVSLLAYANNLNKPGFGYTELLQAGGLDRTRSNLNGSSTSIWTNGSGSGISINGVNFGGAQSYGGISTSRGAGINMNHAPNLKRSFYLQYFFGDLNIDRLMQSNVKQYKGDTVITNNTILTGDVITHSHNFGTGLRLKPDSVTNILINANYSLGLQDEQRISNISSNHNKTGDLSFGKIVQQNDAKTNYYRHSISISRASWTKKGRRWNFAHGLDINNRLNNYSTDADIHFINPTPYDSALDQLRIERLPRTDAYANATYSEPLSKKFTLRLSTRYEYGKIDNGISTYNPGATNQFDKLNSLLSSHFDRESHRLNTSAGFEFRWKDLTITPSIKGLWQKVNNSVASLKDPIRQEQFDILPGFGLTYKTFNIFYDKNISLPSFNYLIPVTDNTNPYNIVMGNSNLLPSERHNFNINYNLNDPKKNLNIWLGGGGGFVTNDIVQSITIDDKGVQTSYPVNANGTKNFWLNYNISRQYKNNQAFIFSFNYGGWCGYNRNKLLFNGETTFQGSYNINQWAGFNMNWNDKFEWNPSYSLGYNFTQYTTTTFKKLETLQHNFETEFIVRMPKHLIWETNLQYSYNGNIPAGLPKDAVRWNAAINFTMLKNEAGVLKFAVYDILNRSANVFTWANRNVVTTSTQNVLGQYFLATFTYNIRPFGNMKKKVGGSRLFLF